jgi:hypothetical protein
LKKVLPFSFGEIMNVTSSPPKHTVIKRAFVNAASLGSNTILSAATGGQIRVLSMALVAGGAVSVKLQSAANDISALFALSSNGGLVLPFNEHGWFETNVNEALNLNLSAAVATGVSIQYIVL